jgi:hypothetical protein
MSEELLTSSGSPIRPDRQRALALLAGSRDGMPEAVMTAYGFTAEQLDELVQAGLAAKNMRRVPGSGRPPLNVVWLAITDDGRVMLAAALRAHLRG